MILKQKRLATSAYGTFLLLCSLAPSVLTAQDIVELGDRALNCEEDAACINRIHPAIPMAARAAPGTTIVFHTRNASDTELDPAAKPDPRADDPGLGAVHPLTGPVYIEGAEPGDVLKVRILDVAPGDWAFTVISPIGFVSDVISEPLRVLWRLNRDYATSPDLPGLRIPNRSFPGVVATLPGYEEHAQIVRRENALMAAGGTVMPPNHPRYASPAAVCGETGTHRDECLRTIPPREHGGNLDIRYLQAGVSIYLPCGLPGCGLAIGDLHYAQGDGEVSGTALEMDGTVTVTTELIKGGANNMRAGPHYEGPSTLLDIPSRTFYATTGFPLKSKDHVPPDVQYLESKKVADLENLSKDISLAARNALLEMIEYISNRFGYTREQAYIIASVAVDLRIGQLVDAPNVGVTALLPLDIFENPPNKLP